MKEDEGLKAAELYLEEWKDITEIANELRVRSPRPATVRKTLEEKGIEVENLEEAIEQRIYMAINKGLDKNEALKFIRPDTSYPYNKRKYSEDLEMAGIYDKEEISEKTEKYMVPSEIGELAATYWFLKNENMGVGVGDLVYFFNEGLNYDEVEDRPNDPEEVLDFLDSAQREGGDSWFTLRDDYIFPSLSEYAESMISQEEEHKLDSIYDRLVQ